MLLTVPDDVARRLHAWLAGETNDMLVEAKLGGERGRTALRIDGKVLHAKIATLPTVIETHKSLDGVTFFKTGEVNQVMVARDTASDELPSATLADGLTPPLVDVQKRKWRKRPAREPAEVEQVAVELESLRGGSLKPEFELSWKEKMVPDPAALSQPEPSKLASTPPSALEPTSNLIRIPAACVPSQGATSESARGPTSNVPRGLLGFGPAASANLQFSSHGAPPSSRMGRVAPGIDSAARAPPAVQPRPSTTAPVGRSTGEPAARPRPEETRPQPPAARAPPHMPVDPEALNKAHAEVQRQQAEVQRIEADITRFRGLLPRVASHGERSKLQLKIDQLVKQKEAAVRACETATAALHSLRG